MTLSELYDVALLDLDGTVYVGPHAVPHAVDSLTAAASRGMRLIYTTNNAARTPEEVATQLRGLGLTLTAADVLTSAQVAAHFIATEVGAHARVLPVGGPGVRAALEAAGLTVVESAAEQPDAVMQGYGPDVSWRNLAEASYAVAAGAKHYATNLDLSIPTAGGIAPGNGTLVRAVVTATGVEPRVTGKPFSPMFDLAVERSRASRALIVGDRLDTDIEGGFHSGLDTLFVLTGVDGLAALFSAEPTRRPTYVAFDLRGLTDDPLAVSQTEATWSGAGWTFSADGSLIEQGARAIDGVQVAARAIWATRDAGHEVSFDALVEQLDAALAAESD